MKKANRRMSWVWWILAGLPALMALDALMGLGYRTDTAADVTVIAAHSGAAHRVIVFFPGYIMSGDTVGRAFAPYITDNDAMVVVNYAERGVDVPQIYDKVMAALNTLRPGELWVYGGSMGGMLSTLFLDRYGRADAPYGKVTLILDSAPASRHNIKRSTFWLDASCWYRGGPLSSAIWAATAKLGVKPPTEDGANQDIIRAARHAGAWVGMPAATSQACFIARFNPPKKSDLLNVVQQAVYLEGHSPGDDPIVRISGAIADWQKTFPDLRVVTLQGRSGRWHLPLVEYPRETVQAIIATGP